MGRSVKTAQRWKAERGLPVYQDRVTGRVHSFRDEIDDWLRQQHGLEDEDEPQNGSNGDADETEVHVSSTGNAKRRRHWVVALILLLAVAFGVAISRLLTKPATLAPEKITARRLLWRATAEGRRFDTIETPTQAAQLALTTDNSRIIGVDNLDTSVWVIDLRTKAVEWIKPGTTVMSLAVAPDGKALYIGSGQDGLVKVELPSLKVAHTIPTGGAITDIAITPDSKQVFLAMMHKGIKKFDPSDNSISEFRRDPCPYFAEVSPSGKLLAVSDQCGGVEGREGHDVVEVLDIATRKSLHLFKGPPMVGGELKFSPDEEFLWLDAWDACRTPKYDHEGCPAVPAWIWQVFRLPVDRLVKTVVLPVDSARPPLFLSRSTVATFARSIAVYDAVRFSVREQTNEVFAGTSVISSDGRRVFAEAPHPELGPKLFVFEREPEECAAPETNLVHFLPFDGSPGDWMENASVGPEETAKFVPGVVGQAIELDGAEKLFFHSSAATPFSVIPSTLTMYVKPRGKGPMPLLDYPRRAKAPGWALRLDEDLRPVWQMEPINSTAVQVAATRSLEPGKWNHVAFVRDGDSFLEYVNGEPAGSIRAPGLNLRYNPQPIAFGHSPRLPGRFTGAIDEFAVWSRPFAAAEIKAEFAKRMSGACRP
ncbi:MAG: hypothetical protein IT168_25125 [Bryobacterales bacterium]|nr:hypothetical protein [Bryobacterales bacterium]